MSYLNQISLFNIMSHSKFEKPRAKSMGFVPRKRTRHHRGRIRSFPKDDPTKKPHFTAFMGFKAGMTNIVRDKIKPGPKKEKREVVEAVTILECPPMIVVGIVGYYDTPRGLRSIGTVWTEHISDECKRTFYKSFYKSKKKAFTKYAKKYSDPKEKKEIDKTLSKIRKYATSVRAIMHTQMHLLNLRQKKAHILEIQVNGGTTEEKVEFVTKHFEKPIRIGELFSNYQYVDTLGVSKGHGFKGVVGRFGVRKVQKKSHRGNRKVGCIGAWHPERVQSTVQRAGQLGYYHRTEINKKIYKIWIAVSECKDGNARVEADQTKKNITPLGGFPHYGIVTNDYLMIKGCTVGVKKRPTIIRMAMHPKITKKAEEPVELKFIDTASKMGHGRFQTAEEKEKFYSTNPDKAPSPAK